MRFVPFLFLLSMLPGIALAAEPQPAWETAWKKGPMNAEETKAFMKRLAQFVFDNHLKKNPNSPQRGMVYEYMDTTRKGQFDQFVQGEGLDTMHDGAWFAAALVNAYRATGDAFYKDFLTKWVLPFYLKMLNHSDELFTAKGAVAREGGKPWDKPWAFQEGEKGFIPYWWDDGGSVSLERRQDKNPLPIRPSQDFTVGKPNPNALLNGYSLGMSNHMAQDIGVMLQLAWLLFKDSQEEAGKKLAAELAEAAKDLHESRMRHHGPIPMCVAPAALANNDPELMKRVPDPEDKKLWDPSNHYTRALHDFEPGKQYSFPGFADDQQYRYYFGVARAGGKLPKPLAFKTIYDAYTEPMLFRAYCDDWEVPPGINKFDLFPYNAGNGKPTDYRSERRGPRGTVKPLGSRFGPQNMVCCGWALQALEAYPGIWEERYSSEFSNDHRAYIVEGPLERPGEAPNIPLKIGGVDAQSLSSKREHLTVSGMRASWADTLRVFSRPDAKGSHAVIMVKRAQVSLLNDGKQGLLCNALIVDEKKKGLEALAEELFRQANREFLLIVMVPYTFAKGQKRWLNGIEHGRYSVQVGNDLNGWKTRNFYLASPERQVKAWLERELGCGLRTWQAIFDEKGYIPTSIGSTYDWDKYSDTGGYAHLLSAAAQWLLVLEGNRDWEMHKIPLAIK